MNVISTGVEKPSRTVNLVQKALKKRSRFVIIEVLLL